MASRFACALLLASQWVQPAASWDLGGMMDQAKSAASGASAEASATATGSAKGFTGGVQKAACEQAIEKEVGAVEDAATKEVEKACANSATKFPKLQEQVEKACVACAGEELGAFSESQSDVQNEKCLKLGAGFKAQMKTFVQESKDAFKKASEEIVQKCMKKAVMPEDERLYELGVVAGLPQGRISTAGLAAVALFAVSAAAVSLAVLRRRRSGPAEQDLLDSEAQDVLE